MLLAALWVLALLAASVQGRPINYFDMETRALPLPNPPGFGAAPSDSAWFRETRDVAALADGGTSARPMQHWDLAVLRTFTLSKSEQHTFLMLLHIESNRTFFLDLGANQAELLHARLATGGALHREGCGPCVCMCVYVCVCVRERVCVCLCLCVSMCVLKP